MKKSLLFIFMLLTAVVSTQAQYKWLLFKGGASIARQGYNSQENTEYGSVLSPVVGVGYEYGLNGENQLAIQPEILYFQKGTKEVYNDVVNGSGSETTNNFRLSNIEIPVLLKYSIGDVDEKRLSFLAGPSFGYILGGKIKTESNYILRGTSSETSTYEEKIKFGKYTYNPNNPSSDAYYVDANRFGIGFHAGVAGNMKFGFGSLFADFRYCLGLTNFYKSGSTDYSSTGAAKHKYWLFTVGYMIPLDVN